MVPQQRCCHRGEGSDHDVLMDSRCHLLTFLDEALVYNQFTLPKSQHTFDGSLGGVAMFHLFVGGLLVFLFICLKELKQHARIHSKIFFKTKMFGPCKTQIIKEGESHMGWN